MTSDSAATVPSAADAGRPARRRRPADAQRVPAALLLSLTFSTGIVDAVGYLGLDRVFVGNMTGNVVILGMAMAGGGDLPVLGPVVGLAAFLVGAIAAGRVLRGVPEGWSRRVEAVFVAVAVLLAASAVAVLVGMGLGADGVSAPRAAHVVVTALMACAMGGQAAAARQVKVADVTTVVVTSTITGLAGDSWLGRRTGQNWVRRVSAVVLVLLGALAGALMLQVHLVLGVVVSAAITAAVAIVGAWKVVAARA